MSSALDAWSRWCDHVDSVSSQLRALSRGTVVDVQGLPPIPAEPVPVDLQARIASTRANLDDAVAQAERKREDLRRSEALVRRLADDSPGHHRRI